MSFDIQKTFIEGCAYACKYDPMDKTHCDDCPHMRMYEKAMELHRLANDSRGKKETDAKKEYVRFSDREEMFEYIEGNDSHDAVVLKAGSLFMKHGFSVVESEIIGLPCDVDIVTFLPASIKVFNKNVINEIVKRHFKDVKKKAFKQAEQERKDC